MEERVIVPKPEMPDVGTVLKWLEICSRDDTCGLCSGCPYSGGDRSYEEGCGKLLADAARIIKFLM